MGTPTVRNIGLAEVAKTFDVSPATLERQPALLGWGIVVNEAERLAASDAFGRGTAHPKVGTAAGNMEQDLPLTEWKHMEAAFRALVPQLGALRLRSLGRQKIGVQGQSTCCTTGSRASAKSDVQAVRADASGRKWHPTGLSW